MSDPRTLRQRLVVEIGEVGQAHLGRATAVVPTKDRLEGEVEARYLAGAGFGLVRTATHAATRAVMEAGPHVAFATDGDEVTLSPPNTLVDALEAAALHPAVRAVAVASARALHQIRVAARVDLEPIRPAKARPGGSS